MLTMKKKEGRVGGLILCIYTYLHNLKKDRVTSRVMWGEVGEGGGEESHVMYIHVHL